MEEQIKQLTPGRKLFANFEVNKIKIQNRSCKLASLTIDRIVRMRKCGHFLIAHSKVVHSSRTHTHTVKLQSEIANVNRSCIRCDRFEVQQLKHAANAATRCERN